MSNRTEHDVRVDSGIRLSWGRLESSVTGRPTTTTGQGDGDVKMLGKIKQIIHAKWRHLDKIMMLAPSPHIHIHT